MMATGDSDDDDDDDEDDNFVTCNYCGEYQKLQLVSGFKPTNN